MQIGEFERELVVPQPEQAPVTIPVEAPVEEPVRVPA